MRAALKPFILYAGMCTTAILLQTAAAPSRATDALTAPELLLGERVFKEGRFAQYFAAHYSGDVNEALASGDPTLDAISRGTPNLPGPYAGKTMSCAACHLTDEVSGATGGGMRAFNDFAIRSAIPDRGDGLTVTTRNTPTIKNVLLDRRIHTIPSCILTANSAA